MKTSSGFLSRNQCGLTLIESLVVITLTVILLALIMPVAGKIRASAELATCASNMRQIYIAMSQHASDHKGILIPADSGPEPKYGMRSNMRWYQSQWEGVLPYASPLADYIGNDTLARIVVCPCNTESFTGHTVGGVILKSRYGWPYSVCYSVIISSTRFQDGRLFSLFQVKNPSQIPLLSDSNKGGQWGIGWEGSYAPHPNQSTIGEPHSKRSNVVWMDGHVTNMTRDELIAHIANRVFE